ncbi:response regulator transcription factor [Streptomyces sp. DSM 44915]|uniref:Response regulator transcription factor n=1 Tax=Streptomyces chisholmiae TaxID=3075540 RepID=A0ABU2JTT1_9ACTN|nr:response regulator transcription factor [Streptomyces sp. DSM 44915]MDT0268327.1 response regulator transcription factor [Streptomyces sp. DSM 44915]
MTLRVVVVDDRRLVAEALASALRVRGHRVLGAGAPSARAAELVRGKQPEVCLFGCGAPEAPGALAPVARVLDEAPRCAVVVLGPVPRPRGVAAAFAAGARGYVRHDERIEGVERALARARAGEVAVAPQLLRDAFAELLNPGDAAHAEGARLAGLLTDREAAVLVRIVEGEDTRRIAAGLGVAPSTARTHVQRLLTKLGTASRLEAAALAVRTGLLEHLPARAG